jgi:hypothetical protein
MSILNPTIFPDVHLDHDNRLELENRRDLEESHTAFASTKRYYFCC